MFAITSNILSYTFAVFTRCLILFTECSIVEIYYLFFQVSLVFGKLEHADDLG